MHMRVRSIKHASMKILSISDIVVPELSEHFDARQFDGVELA